MRFVLYTNYYSPHELPLFRACAGVFEEAWYVVDYGWQENPTRIGWKPDLTGLNTFVLGDFQDNDRASRLRDLLDHDTVIMYGSRGNPYEELIQSSPAIVIYASERWLKPRKWIPGLGHFLKRSFVIAARRYRKMIHSNPRSFYFGLGIHAVRDMAFLTGMGRVSGFEKVPAGEVRVGNKSLSQIRLWGYFVEKGIGNREQGIGKDGQPLRVLWVGRMLALKRIDTIIRAVAEVAKRGTPITCTLVGSGPEESRLKKLASDLALTTNSQPLTTFLPFVPITEVRQLMREHDVYVLSSDRHEGWGAVVNEALDEGMTVLCSREAGSGATMLPDECLFRAGDYRELSEKLSTVRIRPGIGAWTPQEAARRLYDFAKGVQ